MAIRTIEQIKNELRDTEQELYRLKNEFSNIEFLGVNQAAYQAIQEAISFLQNEINNDTRTLQKHKENLKKCQGLWMNLVLSQNNFKHPKSNFKRQ